jgi:hypothetical protein
VFETAGMLSGRAVSAVDGCTSVYEFRSGGAISGGSVHLISDGQDVQRHEGQCGAEFAHMDGSGANILFLTADSLLSGDVDGGQQDVYDAREGGGFAPGAAGGESAFCVPGECEGAWSEGPVPVPGSMDDNGEDDLVTDSGGGIGSGKKEKSSGKEKGKRKRRKRRRRVKGFLRRLAELVHARFSGRGK